MAIQCPSCGNNMTKILVTREYKVDTHGLGSSGKFLALYQCMECKLIKTEPIDPETEKWKTQYNNILKENGVI